MHTIGQLVKRYSLSRSTLLYYDSIGLLQPSGRSDANYRLYSDSDLKRMDKISLFRSAGMSLESISALLDREGDGIQFALEQRLFSINSEIQIRIVENNQGVFTTHFQLHARSALE